MESTATIEYTKAQLRSYKCGLTDCVYAACDVAGDRVGPVAGHLLASVALALAKLTLVCACDADEHVECSL